MRCNIRQTTLVGLAAGLLTAGAASAQIIQNGDFETGTLGGWTVSGVVSAVTEGEYFGPGPTSGNYVAAFGGGVGTGHEVLSQSFSTVVGQSYVLAYDWAFVVGQANILDVTVGGVTHSFCCSGAPEFDFAHDAILFVGSGNDTVSFSVLDSRFDSTDTAIDNVSVHGVPEPATWALMIGGFGLAGMALRRRRTAALAA